MAEVSASMDGDRRPLEKTRTRTPRQARTSRKCSTPGLRNHPLGRPSCIQRIEMAARCLEE
eukprot:5201016-Alexandrium_andersonii.AAC.1